MSLQNCSSESVAIKYEVLLWMLGVQYSVGGWSIDTVSAESDG